MYNYFTLEKGKRHKTKCLPLANDKSLIFLWFILTHHLHNDPDVFPKSCPIQKLTKYFSFAATGSLAAPLYSLRGDSGMSFRNNFCRSSLKFKVCLMICWAVNTDEWFSSFGPNDVEQKAMYPLHAKTVIFTFYHINLKGQNVKDQIREPICNRKNGRVFFLWKIQEGYDYINSNDAPQCYQSSPNNQCCPETWPYFRMYVLLLRGSKGYLQRWTLLGAQL